MASRYACGTTLCPQNYESLLLLSFGSTTRHNFRYYRRRFEAAAFFGTLFRTGEVQERRIEPQSERLLQPR
jgi:hypothetical protein